MDCATELDITVSGEVSSGIDAVHFLRYNEVDLVITDIQMPEMSGITLAKQIQSMENPPSVIFSTAFSEHGVEAFEIGVSDYLLKPVRLERLTASLKKIKNIQSLAPKQGTVKKKFIQVTVPGGSRLVNIEDILYLFSDHKYTTIKTRDKEYLSDTSLVQFEETMGSSFIRIHRNCLVPVDRIMGIDKRATPWTIMLRDVSDSLNISRRQQSAIKNLLEKM